MKKRVFALLMLSASLAQNFFNYVCLCMRHLPRLASLATLLISSSIAFAENVIVDPSTGCQIANDRPVTDESITWSGECKNGKTSGFGVLQWFKAGQLNAKYEGGYQDGKRSGHGTIEYVSGAKFEGDWKDGKMNGHGTAVFNGGDKYDGNFKEGKVFGHGTMVFKSGNKYEGDWNGLQNGHGTMVYASGNEYDGEWKDGKRNGHGTMVYKNGNKYDGDWRDNNLIGKGNYTWANGDTYEGDFVDGKLEGEGKKTTAAGQVYEGEWKAGALVSSTTNASEGLSTFLSILGSVAQGYADVQTAKNEQRAAALAQQREQAKRQQALQAQQAEAAYAEQARQAAQFDRDREQQQQSALAQQQAAANKVATAPAPTSAQKNADEKRYWDKVGSDMESSRKQIAAQAKFQADAQKWRDNIAADAAKEKARAEQIAQRARAEQQQKADEERKNRQYWENQRQIDIAEKNALNAEASNPNSIRVDTISCGVGTISFAVCNRATKASIKGVVSWRVTGTPTESTFESQGGSRFVLEHGQCDRLYLQRSAVDCNQRWTFDVTNISQQGF
jgi:hypothetical protein